MVKNNYISKTNQNISVIPNALQQSSSSMVWSKTKNNNPTEARWCGGGWGEEARSEGRRRRPRIRSGRPEQRRWSQLERGRRQRRLRAEEARSRGRCTGAADLSGGGGAGLGAPGTGAALGSRGREKREEAAVLTRQQWLVLGLVGERAMYADTMLDRTLRSIPMGQWPKYTSYKCR